MSPTPAPRRARRLRKYRSVALAVFMSLFVGGGLVFTGATLFRSTDKADQKAEKVENRAATNTKIIKRERRRNRTIERIIVRAGIAKRGLNGKLGPAGPRGPQGRRGATGPPAKINYTRLARQLSRSLSDEEIGRLAAAICTTHRCEGIDGKNGRDGRDGKDAVITQKEIQAAADLICGGKAPCPPSGTPGPQGPPGPGPASFGFFAPPTGPNYTCTDPEGDGSYACTPDPV